MGGLGAKFKTLRSESPGTRVIPDPSQLGLVVAGMFFLRKNPTITVSYSFASHDILNFDVREY